MRDVLLWELTAGARFSPANQDTHWVFLLFTPLWSEMDVNANDWGSSIKRGFNDRVETICKVEKGGGKEVRIKKGVNGPEKDRRDRQRLPLFTLVQHRCHADKYPRLLNMDPRQRTDHQNTTNPKTKTIKTNSEHSHPLHPGQHIVDHILKQLKVMELGCTLQHF